MKPWSNRRATRELLDIMRRVPLPVDGAGTQSATVRGFVNFSRDERVFRRIAYLVLYAVNTRAPHPVWGDDGAQEDARKNADEALEWAEKWLTWRDADGWQSRVCDYGSSVVEEVKDAKD